MNRVYLGNGVRCFAVFIYLLVLSASAGQAQPSADFARANDEFAKGKFQDAIRDYQALVDARQWSAPVFYNLGNAYYRAGDFGRAILNYERALTLDPQHPESAANLALAREEARSLEIPDNRIDVLLKHVTANQLVIAAAIAFWLTLFVITSMFLSRRRSAILWIVVVLGIFVAIGSGALVYYLETSRSATAIVTAENVRARLATADNASSVMQLPEGSEIRIVSQRGDWVYASLPNNSRGWVPTSSLEPVQL